MDPGQWNALASFFAFTVGWTYQVDRLDARAAQIGVTAHADVINLGSIVTGCLLAGAQFLVWYAYPSSSPVYTAAMVLFLASAVVAKPWPPALFRRHLFFVALVLALGHLVLSGAYLAVVLTLAIQHNGWHGWLAAVLCLPYLGWGLLHSLISLAVWRDFELAGLRVRPRRRT